jgi:hypothetical protein
MVCKTFIHRFDSSPRLQQLNLFFYYFGLRGASRSISTFVQLHPAQIYENPQIRVPLDYLQAPDYYR